MCFPECYVPGYRGLGHAPPAVDEAWLERAWSRIGEAAKAARCAAVIGTERFVGGKVVATALVIDAKGERLGFQDKVQIDPDEEGTYEPAEGRRVFELDGVTIGVVICHEGWRYPETVRWAAVRGAKIVFHPQLTGSDREGARPTQWGAAGGAYYEKAMMMRSIENAIYFASVNYGVRFQESATSLIAPSGRCQAYLPYGQEGVLVQRIELEEATGLLASRYAPERYRELEPG